jgi:hypothetical protein
LEVVVGDDLMVQIDEGDADDARETTADSFV